MGTWGTAVFSDDLAADVRDHWRGHIADGLSAEDATERVLAFFLESLTDPDDAGVLWIALAVSQWKTGRLVPAVRDPAIAVIDSGDDLRRWDTAQLRKARQRVLTRTREMLLSAQPEAKRVRRRWIRSTPFELGDVVQVDLLSGDTTLLVVVGRLDGANGDRSPMFATLNWVAKRGDALPADLNRLELTTPVPSAEPPNWPNPVMWPARKYFVVAQTNKRDDRDPERVRLVGHVEQEGVRSNWEMTWWCDLDLYLRARLGLRIDDIET